MRPDITPIGDMASVTIILSAFAGWLPSIASILSIVWLGLRCYEAWLNIQNLQRTQGQRDVHEKKDN